MPDHTSIRSGAYYDSVSLMQVSAVVRTTPGVLDCLIGMGTPLNLELIESMGFEFDDAPGPNDMVIAVRGESQDAVTAGLAALDRAFEDLTSKTSRGGDISGAELPRTIGAAADRAGLALISVPGSHAYVDAMDAVTHGMSVMLFSDNVSVQQEIELKRSAAEHDVLVMGPDCGTAVVNGAALGFANVVRRGPIGLVAASGTGAQQVMTLLDAAGLGISHCLGVGGRDLSSEVGGLSTVQALHALSEDPGTERVIVVSKPPADEVLTKVQEFAATLPVSVHWATLGAGRSDLTASVESVLAATGKPDARWPSWVQRSLTAPGSGSLRGLYCGGTLADEAMLIAAELGVPTQSNIPLHPELSLGPDLTAKGDLVIDFGDDTLTQGRPHPMIDPSLRLDRIRIEGRDPSCGVLLLDLVLGYGAHRDPARSLALAITEARTSAAEDHRELPVVVALIGTEADPQGLRTCVDVLSEAGASVFVSNAQAVRHALSLLTSHREAR